MSCSNCYYYWNDEKYCPKREMNMMKGDSCKYWKPNDAMSISQRMNERSQDRMNEKQCFLCGKEIDWHYYVLPFGFICYDCGKKIINHLQQVVEE